MAVVRPRCTSKFPSRRYTHRRLREIQHPKARRGQPGKTATAIRHDSGSDPALGIHDETNQGTPVRGQTSVAREETRYKPFPHSSHLALNVISIPPLMPSGADVSDDLGFCVYARGWEIQIPRPLERRHDTSEHRAECF